MRQITYALLTRSPVYLYPEGYFLLDLHVLCTPPALVLSQDQTLHCKLLIISVEIVLIPLKTRAYQIVKNLLFFYRLLYPVIYLSSTAWKVSFKYLSLSNVFI